MSLLLITAVILGLSLIPRTVHTKIVLDTEQKNAWNVLVDFNRYKEWNPFIKSIEGELIVGNRLDVVLKQNSSNDFKISPTLTNVVDGENFSWRGHLGVPYIFTGEHSFSLDYNENKELVLTHSERFQGLLVWPMFSIINSTQDSFKSMNEALKKRLITA